MNRTSLRLIGVAAGMTLLAACSGADPLEGGSGSGSGGSATGGEGGQTIVIGSQDYYSNEIIAEIYAQVLEADGFDVQREFRIGQREVYMPELESGDISLFPEYSGPVLQYWVDAPAQRTSDEVYDALVAAAPEGLQVLDQAPATDQDSYVVTSAYAQHWGLTSIGDLANVSEPITLGANSELENRPNGPTGLKDTYGVDVAFTPIEDGGGPLTVGALQDGSIQLALLYTGDPTIATSDLVVLEDPEGLFLASNIVPLAAADLPAEAVDAINEVSAKLTSDQLLELNRRSVDEQLPAAQIATDWVQANSLA